MNSRNSNPKYRQSNKRRGISPILKFALILALVFVIGFFIFYSIDNPGFLKEKISSVSSVQRDSGDSEGSGNGEDTGKIITSSEESEGRTEDGKAQTAVTENEESLKITGENIGQGEGGSEDEGKTGSEIDTGSNINITNPDENDSKKENSNGENEDNAGGTSGSPSFWQKIINFITRSENNDKEENTYPSSLNINFYFSALGEEKKLASEKRTINAGSPAIAAQNAILELLKGPIKPHHFSVIPAGTKLLGVEVNENIAKVDFSQEFLENSLDTSILDEYVIYSIVNTLTEIPDIEGVIFYIEGIRIKVYGNVDLSIPAIRNKDFIEEE